MTTLNLITIGVGIAATLLVYKGFRRILTNNKDTKEGNTPIHQQIIYVENLLKERPKDKKKILSVLESLYIQRENKYKIKRLKRRVR